MFFGVLFEEELCWCLVDVDVVVVMKFGCNFDKVCCVLVEFGFECCVLYVEWVIMVN